MQAGWRGRTGAMDFAIASAHSRAADGNDREAWEVLCLCSQRGAEVALPLATFGHRPHAEAFLADLLAGPIPGGPGHADGV